MMQNLKKQLQNNALNNIYLFTGEENYLKNTYRERVKSALLPSDDMMNYSYYEGKQIKVSDVTDIADTLPFFSDKRLIIVQNSELFKSGKKEESALMADYIEKVPSSTYMVFIEDEVDKRSKLYKVLNKVGQVVVFNKLNESEIKKWVKHTAKKNNMSLSDYVAEHFIYTVGIDMETVEKEMDKLISYSMDKKGIEMEDIEAVCTPLLENKIFEMIDAIGNKNKEKAIVLYNHLLLLKEPPLRVLFMLVRQFRMILQVKGLSQKGISEFEISKALSIRQFIVKNCMRQGKNFSQNKLKEALEDCLEYEKLVKTGRLEDKIAVEMIVIKYSL
ncbi:DNA polymerase III delta subunit [Natranaerovirga hydrolytica]|uniref:DNA polymerase III subunit delta n=1 Tax=Natranaerovirga hydrolytica TaxID=680378 RepID=A0A4R1MYM9_9FIRM|nr:DNA polymerase III subunit delta [Natranaerovirga hydrolytica]TCK98407.1 DNA polymerase III delta subunit [Natranaerovirga hydrolytica]